MTQEEMQSRIFNKIVSATQAQQDIARFRLMSESIVFTNGCFDLLHPGHIAVLTAAKSMGSRLIVGLNSDLSVRRLKGEQRPIQNQNSRALVLASLLFVDRVVIFEEDTPLRLIQDLRPDVLVKGGDYTIANIVGAEEVQAAGGKVVIVPLKEGFSTTGLIEKSSDA